HAGRAVDHGVPVRHGARAVFQQDGQVEHWGTSKGFRDAPTVRESARQVLVAGPQTRSCSGHEVRAVSQVRAAHPVPCAAPPGTAPPGTAPPGTAPPGTWPVPPGPAPPGPGPALPGPWAAPAGPRASPHGRRRAAAAPSAG